MAVKLEIIESQISNAQELINLGQCDEADTGVVFGVPIRAAMTRVSDFECVDLWKADVELECISNMVSAHVKSAAASAAYIGAAALVLLGRRAEVPFSQRARKRSKVLRDDIQGLGSEFSHEEW
eukprot:CAMPEP_0167831044 /NCGR_PEP_ID=MMETSP0112_2-20121227/13358_1 /TAXON_ID=91324 /ORGANISM="Lotharella globosa, Strain CCCM811" /LENGTH=123 /DNA_ID=CAMNT_0007735529 /DNA_START=3238 /DNA_END=3610 /DNA_ORIENTATION=+